MIALSADQRWFANGRLERRSPTDSSSCARASSQTRVRETYTSTAGRRQRTRTARVRSSGRLLLAPAHIKFYKECGCSKSAGSAPVRQNCKLQLGELLADRTGRHVLGRAVAYLPVVENRPRGYPHTRSLIMPLSLQSLAVHRRALGAPLPPDGTQLISGTATAGSARHWEVLGYPAACKDRGTVVPTRIPGSCCRCELDPDWVILTARSHVASE